jgi:transcriptional regulator with XRE-family HTH domain
MHTGNNLRKIRELLDFSQGFLAQKLKITQQAYSKIEQMEIIPDIKLEKIATILKIKKEKIMDFDSAQIVNTIYDNGNVINHQYNPIEKIIELYEKIIAEKDKEILALKKQIKA